MVNITAPAANQISEEIARNLMILTNAFYAEWIEGELHKDFPSISVLHATSFHMWQYGQIKPQFLARAALIEPQARKGKKDVYSIGSHMYIAESRLEIDSYRDAPIFQQMMDELASQNFKQLMMIKEKRTVRKVMECMTYGDFDDADANPFSNAANALHFIADDGLNSANLPAEALSSNPNYVLEGAKTVPVVKESTAVTLTTGDNATNALELKASHIDGDKLIQDLFDLRSSYMSRTERQLIKPAKKPLGVVRVPRQVLDALRTVANLGNADFTSVNTDLLTKYPEALGVAGFTIVPADETFAIFEQADTGAYHNLPVNATPAVIDYSKVAFTDGTDGYFCFAFAYTTDALVHAEVMPIQFRLFQTPQQQSMTQYFQSSNDTVIIEPGQVTGLVTKPAV